MSVSTVCRPIPITRSTERADIARAQKTNADMIMRKLPLDPPVADRTPTASDLTIMTANISSPICLLDADAEGADWAEVARNVLHIDPSDEPDRARRAWGGEPTWRVPNG
jgi:hypothetical protein